MCPLKDEAQRGACLFFVPSSACSSATPHAAGSGRRLSSSVWLLAETGCHQPSAFLLHQMCRPGKQKSDQLTGLRFQPAISASSTARQDFAKIHIRQLLRTLLFCLYHLEHAVCLSVCLSPRPRFQARSSAAPPDGQSVVKEKQPDAPLHLPKDSVPWGVEASWLGCSSCPSVTQPSSCPSFHRPASDVPQWTREPSQAHQRPPNTTDCSRGHTLLRVSSLACSLMRSCHCFCCAEILSASSPLPAAPVTPLL